MFKFRAGIPGSARGRTAVIASVSAVALAGGALSPSAATGQAVQPQAGVVHAEQADGVRGQVTLLSGDKVTVVEKRDGRLSPLVRPAKGRERMSFQIQQTPTGLFVLPRDAMAEVGSGKLDRRLFDVKALLDYGYDDARRSDLPLIVKGDNARSGALERSGTRVGHRFGSINAVAARQDKSSASALWNARGSVDKIWLDGMRKPSLDVSVPQIGAPKAWEAGHTGKGVKVAVLDTGVDATHPDLAGKVVDANDFTGENNPDDTHGHGTHVASTIAGTGAKSGGKFKGVAPEASLLNGKVCGYWGCPESAIMAGMQWAAESGARVVNMSLGGLDVPEVDPMEEAVNQLTARHGTLFVVAAGNSGGDETVGSPASADAALAVGAVDKNDQLAWFSSRGPRLGDSAVKPEITAPGVDIVAAKDRNGAMNGPGPDGYQAMSGTSMATPHVAGAAAILAGQRPDLSAAQYKSLLMGSAKPNPALGVHAQGAGRVDVARAVGQSVSADPPAVSLGRAIWPHQDDPKITKKVTYRNAGSQPVTFQLALTATGPDGKPAPAAMFGLSTNQLTVPAGGEASADLTADTAVNTADGYYGGQVTATAGDQVVVTPFGVDREAESYDMSFTAVGRDGKPAYVSGFAMNIKTGRSFYFYNPDGKTTRRSPKGDYYVQADVWDGGSLSRFVQPLLSVTKNESMALDARQAKPISVKFDKQGLTPAIVAVSTEWAAGPNRFQDSLAAPSFDDILIAPLGPEAPAAAFTAGITGMYLGGDDSYHVGWVQTGRMFHGLDRTVADRELAAVRNEYHLTKAGSFGVKLMTPKVGTAQGAGLGDLVSQPSTRTEYVYTSGGLSWFGDFLQISDGRLTTTTTGAETRYEPGRNYRESWNTAVFGPSLPDSRTGVIRDKGQIAYRTPVFSDAPNRTGEIVQWDSARSSLFRNGVKVGDDTKVAGQGQWEVPEAEATYRVESEMRQSATDFSTHIQLAQIFRSRHTDTATALPVSVIRFNPAVDLDNHAKAGGWFRLPIQVQTQKSNSQTWVSRLELSVSYDDGKTWQTTTAIPAGASQWATYLRHPAGPGFVSLKAKATDNRGGTTEQTITRAYGLK